ncbi:phosphoethanolamine transferase [Desulforhopalus singaporensis]|nr:phosphoethanolamine--lipid A transferase [Desulforhopalus singaporensis]
MFKNKYEMRPTTLIILVSLFFVLCGNIAFFRNVFAIFPVSSENIVFLLFLAVGLAVLLTFVLTLVTLKYTIKPLLLILLLISSVTAYFMDNYNIVMDDEMVRSVFATDWPETFDLLSWKMGLYVLLLCVVPSLFVCRVKLVYPPVKKSVIYKIITCVASVTIIVAMILGASGHFASFFREHKPLRYYTNPSYYLYSTGKYVADLLHFSSEKTDMAALGKDARVVKVPGRDNGRPKLVVLVVGEAARADHFSLNGYAKKTNPLLQNENIVDFSKMYSCGTTTAYSVPCMFSSFTREDYSPQKGRMYENILDVLTHTKSIEILWRDNNSDSKGVALRVPYEDFQTPATNPVCADGECRDEGMLAGLDRYVAHHPGKDMLIVLHQKGNHGPAYYKRYPKEFERFQPVCRTNQLEKCSRKEIANAYDNALLYTDYFLSRVISFLRGYDGGYNTAMLYYSDHGESLGENNIYLHGLPYVIAPDAQTHVASLMWLGGGMAEVVDLQKIRQDKDLHYSHDNLFHTLLGIFNVDTQLYNRDLDLVSSQETIVL